MATDPNQPLRYYGGLGVIVFAIAPPLMLSLLLSQDSAPRSVVALLAVGIPVNLVAVYFAVRGMAGSVPEAAGRRVGIGLALVAVSGVLMLGGNALLR
ncbi:hypothetical protein [Plantactinospora endophytica]|uniref:Uncharacterized protein n=1 Tax=Plantactinospora endophytica TaxID=673535 RepID=A0ABQ4E8G1_9ACTN|nr:hypothetical protein [Plantactinospora endophytica]GIG91015.1 hypothetical protein Pen02_59510 [Plantactinospora endophytica]